MLNFVSRIIKTCITIGFGSFYGVSEKSIFFIFWAKAVPLEIEAPEGTSLIKRPRAKFWTYFFDLQIFLSPFKKFLQKTKIGRNLLTWVEFQAMRTHFSGVRTLWVSRFFPYGSSILFKSFE